MTRRGNDYIEMKAVVDELQIKNQMKLEDEESGYQSEEITNLKCMARIAQKLREEKLRRLEEGKSRVHMAISNDKNEVYSLISFFIVFAGVLFTAVSTATTLECQHLWSPIGLCLALRTTNSGASRIWRTNKRIESKH